MDDKKIIGQFFEWSEKAIAETALEYENYLHTISYVILSSSEIVEEWLNDTYLEAWKTIPSNRPPSLKFYLVKIT